MNLSKLQEIVKDREACCASVHGATRVGHNLVSEQQIKVSSILKLYFSFLLFLRFLIVSFLSFFKKFIRDFWKIEWNRVPISYSSSKTKRNFVLLAYHWGRNGCVADQKTWKKKRETSREVLFFPRQGYRSLFHFGWLYLDVITEILWSFALNLIMKITFRMVEYRYGNGLG